MNDRMERHVEKLKKKGKKQISLWLSSGVLDKLNNYCEKVDTNRSETVEIIVKLFIEKESK